MRVTILCGGKGTRLGVPVKCLVDMNGKPFIEHKIDQVRWYGFDDITLLVGPYDEEFAYLRLPMISDEQEGIENALRYVPENSWWTWGDTLINWRPGANDAPTMLVTRNTDQPNIAGFYLDCGWYYDKANFTMVETQSRPYHCNTFEDLEETRAYLGR